MKFKLLLLSLFILLSACSSKEAPQLKIIANSWIGYSPLFYAKESGWLDEHNIKLSTVVSLGESMHIYQTNHMHAFTGTQYEYRQVLGQERSLMPIIMFNRSNGGDMVMSNHSLKALEESSTPIDVYLEINSINHVLFKDFIKRNRLENKTFNYINNDQLRILSELESLPKIKRPTIVVTYVPYNHKLKTLGFQTLGSTRNGLDLLVVDALYTNKENFAAHEDQFKALKTIVDRSLQALNNDPHEYYTKVKPYLENNSFEEFQSGLQDIEWLNHELSDALVKRLNQAQFPIRDLM